MLLTNLDSKHAHEDLCTINTEETQNCERPAQGQETTKLPSWAGLNVRPERAQAQQPPSACLSVIPLLCEREKEPSGGRAPADRPHSSEMPLGVSHTLRGREGKGRRRKARSTTELVFILAQNKNLDKKEQASDLSYSVAFLLYRSVQIVFGKALRKYSRIFFLTAGKLRRAGAASFTPSDSGDSEAVGAAPEAAERDEARQGSGLGARLPLPLPLPLPGAPRRPPPRRLTYCTQSVARPLLWYSTMHRISWSFSSSN